MLDRCNQVGNY